MVCRGQDEVTHTLRLVIELSSEQVRAFLQVLGSLRNLKVPAAAVCFLVGREQLVVAALALAEVLIALVVRDFTEKV